MSVSYVPDLVKLKLWVKAGGRCEYPGCNVILYRDNVTYAELNRSYIAHIIADSPEGPRGDKDLSKELAKEFSNLMLLCDTHHRLIDKEDVQGHPVDLLRRYKMEHEERIELLTGIHTNKKTYIVMYGANIGKRDGLISFEQACAAVIPKRYPSTNYGIQLDLTQNATTDEVVEFWENECKNIENFVNTRLAGYGPDGKLINHLSVFALAPIPLLVYFGKKLGDIIAMDVYQRHRDTEDWLWQDEYEPYFTYIVEKPNRPQKRTTDVMLILSLSDAIDVSNIIKIIPKKAALYRITINRPNRDFLKTEMQLEMFVKELRILLSEIRANHGADCKIHLFQAIPIAIAVQIGRLLLPKSDPNILIYDYNRNIGGWQYALTV